MASQNRAEIIDQRFAEFVLSETLPAAQKPAQVTNLSKESWIDLIETQMLSRHLDLRSRRLRARGESYYTIGSAGHEGNAAVAAALRPDDMAFLHYRSGAFYLQRAKQVPGSTPLYDLLLSFAASSEDPIAGGRHKVLGSKELLIPPQTSTIASHLPKAVGTALSIRRARDLGIKRVLKDDAIVHCSFGDASINHATALSGLNTATLCAHQKIPMPILFVCEDNGIGISVPTPNTWVGSLRGENEDLRYFAGDGLSVTDAYESSKAAADYVRKTRKPALLHLRTVRLIGHAGSDVETTYRSLQEIEATEFQDPLLHSARTCLEHSWLSKEEIVNLYHSTRARVETVAEEAIARPKLQSSADVAKSILPTAYRSKQHAPPPASEEKRQTFFQERSRLLKQPQHMARLLNWGLADLLLRYPNTVVFGEDVAQKGGVYNVTAGLYGHFGAKRVFNSPLDETSILGTAIGMAHNGFLPIPEIQFLAYLHNAEDQLRGEAATLSFFSQGQFVNPMVVRIAGLAYQRGFGGHFHNDNSLAVLRDLPGVILACPSRPAEAVQMLRTLTKTAYEEFRVAVFVEPIALYMTKDLHDPGDGQWSDEYPDPNDTIELGDIGVSGEGEDIAMISYGNGYYLCEQARKVLEEQGKKVTTINLRWLTDFSWPQVVDAIGDSKRILVVDECRKSGSLSEAVVTGLYENGLGSRTIMRHTAGDCFIPLGAAATLGLPSKDSILFACQELLGGKR